MRETQTPQVRCLRPGCGRGLTSTASTRAGYGRSCQHRIREAARADALAGFTPEQAAKATELIEQGGLVPSPYDGVYRAVSGDGETVYLTSADMCDCPAGVHGRLCYHVAAVRVLSATAVTA